jgi:hypothetical protein
VEQPKQPKRQVKFECSEQFYKRLLDERRQRSLTLQQIATRALEQYLAVPEYVHRGITEMTKAGLHRLPKAVLDALRPDALLDALSPNAVTLDTLASLPPGARDQIIISALEMVSRLGGAEPFGKRMEQTFLKEEIWHILDQLPLDKLRVLHQELMLDLKYYRSARIRSEELPSLVAATPRKRRGKV